MSAGPSKTFSYFSCPPPRTTSALADAVFVHVHHELGTEEGGKSGGLYTPTAFPGGLRADSVGLRVSRIHIFLLFHHSIFLMIFRCLSEHFWLDHKVQRTFPTDFRWTKSKPTPIVHWKCPTSTNGIPAEVRWNSNGLL